MTYEIRISDAAREQLRGLPREIRRNIGRRIELLRNDLAGDVKKLHGQKNLWRLRVGEYRILFRTTEGIIEVFAVRTRQGAYE